MADPLRSATSPAITEDTSLALPSDLRLRTGQQRVLEQVHSIKRSRSKQGRTGSPTSPLSPTNLSVFSEFGSFKFTPAAGAPSTVANGVFGRSATLNSKGGGGYSRSVSTQKSRSLSNRTMGSRTRNVTSSGQWDQQFSGSVWPQPPNGLKPSRSDPALALPLTPVPAPGPQMRATGQTMQVQQSTKQSRSSSSNKYSTVQSMTASNVQTTSSSTRQMRAVHDGSKMSLNNMVKREPETSAQNDEISMATLTLKDAVDYLSHPEENYQQCGASFIQHCTFKEDAPKQEVLSLGGIPGLVSLLGSPSPEVSQSASAALRNLVFRDHDNKLEVQRLGGIGSALQLLKETDSTETQKQLTGLLWNLSSSDELKGELIATALPVLTESVVVPFTCWSDSSTNNNIHPDVFHSATGCLRNLSCAQKKQRQTMRDCRGLIDSLMSYVQSCVAEENPDDQSVENCACILHNLTYQLEAEAPECFSRFSPPAEAGRGGGGGGKNDSSVGCFSPKSSKLHKENLVDVGKSMKEETTPSGVNWLCHPKAMQAYLTLLGTSQKDPTRQACCGALQNLTANKGLGSMAMSQILVQKLAALPTITPLLRSPNQTLQKTAMCLLGNLSRSSGLQTSIAKQVLPELTGLLLAAKRDMGNNDSTIATACNNVRSLLMADSELSKKVLTPELVTSLADLSDNTYLPKGSKAASLLLYSLWNEKSLQGTMKKLGLSKSLFVNSVTTAAHKSVQVIE